jgi:hypothetical protein
MKTQTAASIPSIPPLVVVSCAHDGDVTVSATFTPTDPVGATEVLITPEPATTCGVLELLDAAIVRLLAYRDGYRAASEKDAAPVLPAPWYRR